MLILATARNFALSNEYALNNEISLYLSVYTLGKTSVYILYCRQDGQPG